MTKIFILDLQLLSMIFTHIKNLHTNFRSSALIYKSSAYLKWWLPSQFSPTSGRDPPLGGTLTAKPTTKNDRCNHIVKMTTSSSLQWLSMLKHGGHSNCSSNVWRAHGCPCALAKIPRFWALFYTHSLLPLIGRRHISVLSNIFESSPLIFLSLIDWKTTNASRQV